jgi:DNA-binding NtrC family response regulator
MPEPILFVVDDDPATLEPLAAVLERRFGADYRILVDVSPESALARIEAACERGEKLALVIADLWTSGIIGMAWLERVRELCPGAGRRRRQRSRVRTSSSWAPATPPVRRPCIWRGMRRR